MTEEEVQGHIDHLKAATMDLPWTHDPRTGPLTQPTREHLAEASRRMKANPMPREEMIRRIVKATVEDIDDLHPEMPTVIGVDWGTGSETVHSLWERGGKRLDWVDGGPVLRQEGDWEPGEVEELVSPDREEFSAWLERDGLREER